MNGLKWWLRIVGVLYLIEGLGTTIMAIVDPGEFAAIWASAPASSLDAVAVRAAKLAGLPGVMTWVLLGAMMLIYSRAPAKATLLVIIVVAWELLVWLPVDIVASFNGFELPRTITLVAVHLVIGVSGMLILRRAGSSSVAARSDPATRPAA
jgi:hypothetical protein